MNPADRIAWEETLATYDRVAVTGAPRTGKTRLTEEVTDRPVFHSDDLRQWPWADVPYRLAWAVRDVPRFVVEGVMVPRAMRKGMVVDAVVVLHVPYVPQTRGQIAMGKGVVLGVLDGLPLKIPRVDLRGTPQGYVYPSAAPRTRKEPRLDLQRRRRRLAEWKASPGACPICMELDGKTVDASIDVEEMAHPNCDCTLEPIEYEEDVA